jgi:ubiquitin carboxyl-terminal hydrolase 34
MTDAHRYAFGDHFLDDVQTEHIFYRFFGAYLRLCSFLLRADAQLLTRASTDDTYSQPLSQKHIRLLFNMFKPDRAPVFHVLHRDYGADALDMIRRLQKEFLAFHGAQNLLRFMDLSFHRLPHALQDTCSMHVSQIFSVIGWTIFELPGANTYIGRSEYNRGVLSFFEKYGSDLQDLSIPRDSGVARDLIVHYANLLNGLCLWDEEIAADLVDLLLDLGDPGSPTASSPMALAASARDTDYRQDPTCYHSLVSNAWKFKILRKYIVKGNMGLRVMSIAAMDTTLVEIWREFNNIGPSCSHPVMQYLADFLSRGQVAEYIVGVDSHPQLISRSGNIVGFLVVTHRWTDEQADAIWKTVATSLDHRVVAATMTVFNSITNLMKSTDHLYLCSKLYELPIERYTIDILRFLRELTGKIIHSTESVDYGARGETARPWNVCIRLIRDTAPCRKADKNLTDMHTEVLDQFRFLTSMIPPHERHAIYRESAEQIADRTLDATGNFKVVCMLLQTPYPHDTSFLEQNEELMRSVLEEIPDFVTKEAEGGPYPSLRTALHYRLDLLRWSIVRAGITIPTDLYVNLWDHVIGERALSDEARNVAWSLLSMAYREAPQNDFWKELVSSYVPVMKPHLYTTGLFEFVSKYKFPTARQDSESASGQFTPLQIPGAELLWPIVLSAPSGTIEDRAARLLASRYVQSIDGKDILPSEFADAQVALADQCMQELRDAMASHSGRSQSNADAESLNEEAVRVRQLTELRISRILLFQKLLLESVRLRPEFNRAGRVDSKVEHMEIDVPTGDTMIVKYQFGNDRQSVTMSANHTMDDLYRRLCHATGYTKLNLFAKGQRLKVFDDSPIRLCEFDFGGQVIAQRADGAEPTKPLPAMAKSTSRFELAILKHFEELFAWMDGDDVISQQVSLLFYQARYVQSQRGVTHVKPSMKLQLANDCSFSRS